jgi:glycosyltransferase involved in cell wall biosynthesis
MSPGRFVSKSPAVAIVVDAYLPARAFGGPVSKIEGLAPGLTGLGVRLFILTSTLSAPNRPDLAAGPDHSLPVPVHRLRPLLSYCWSSIVRWPQALPPHDLMHVVGAWSGLAYQSMWHCWRSGRPFVWEPAGMLAVAGRNVAVKRLLTPLNRWFARRAAAIVWTSRRERVESSVAGLARHECVRPNPAPAPPPCLMNRAAAKREFGIDGEATCWGYLGRIGNRKGIEKLLDAWAAARPSNASLIFAGPVEDAALAARIDAGGASVRRLDPLGDDRRWDFLRAIDCLVLVPDFGENFGNVLVEAVLAGTPVVASPAVGAAEHFAEDPGVEVVASAAELARLLSAPCRLPAPGALPAALAAPAVAAAQVELYRLALAAAGGTREAAA